jgi:hypothetical protein
MSDYDYIEAARGQPRLWVEAMLEEYDSARMPEAKEAILARVGVVLFALFALRPGPRVLGWGDESDG